MTGKMFVMAALGALAAATPAAAQYGSVVDTQSLRAEIDNGVARGDISEEEAADLRSQLRGLINLQRQYADDGLSASERDDLQQRAQGLRNEIASARGDASSSGYGRYRNAPSGYGSNAYGSNGYGQYGNGYYGGNQGAYGNRYGRNSYGTYGTAPYGSNAYGSGAYPNRNYGTYGNGAYDSRTYGNGAYADRYRDDQYDRDDSYNDQRYRSDGRYSRDDSYDENDDEGDAVRVGDRVSGDLTAVPNAYRYRFRDGGGVYYRYGNGNVYQVDARTGVVIRIYPIER